MSADVSEEQLGVMLAGAATACCRASGQANDGRGTRLARSDPQGVRRSRRSRIFCAEPCDAHAPRRLSRQVVRARNQGDPRWAERGSPWRIVMLPERAEPGVCCPAQLEPPRQARGPMRRETRRRTTASASVRSRFGAPVQLVERARALPGTGRQQRVQAGREWDVALSAIPGEDLRDSIAGR
jgi:hypothetical protein